MAPKQNKRRRPTSSRKSMRLKSVQRVKGEAIPRPLSSTLSTETGDETWEVLSSQATDRINKYVQANRKKDDKVISTLLALLEWLPDEGKLSFARDILACDNDDQLHAVFWNLVTGLLFQMKTISRITSVSSSPHEKRRNNAEVVATFLSGPQSRDSKFRRTCLRRDSYKCVVTKQMETENWANLGHPSDVSFGDLEAAHIIPFSYASWNDRPTVLTDISNAWELLYRCFPAIRRVGMSVENINDPSNGITLRGPFHSEFGKFRCAFVATETPHVYTFKTFRTFPTDLSLSLSTDRTVIMQRAAGSEDVNLPSPTFLDCHHRIAEVLNASGMGEVIEAIIREWEDIKTYGGHGSLDPLDEDQRITGKKFNNETIERLADEFAAKVLNQIFSLAEILLLFLLEHRQLSIDAVTDVEDWIAKASKERGKVNSYVRERATLNPTDSFKDIVESTQAQNA
ncbi:hypothetical protein AJ78_08650 [Emergomyces pasteurianus Ep9510]|uniref:HNH nuclease domain-containing protein n=1 Tax=Emergomyces pasteurianus Ep9510 TaxID=1447872 RepID=A0A1J9Q552_9EURO|nr:hypothetical protein AJ78_08650 [Emergomyces pasteurianus Ep9510]